MKNKLLTAAIIVSATILAGGCGDAVPTSAMEEASTEPASVQMQETETEETESEETETETEEAAEDVKIDEA